MEHSTEKPRLRDRVKSRILNAKLAGAAALATGTAAVMAIPQGASATGTTTTLQGLAADWGMSVPSIFVLVMLIIALIAVMGGWARSQYGYYITAGLALVFIVMTYLGI